MTQSEFNYRSTFEALALPATVIDPDGVIIDVNNAFLDLARRHKPSLQRQDRLGRPIWEFAGEQDPWLGRQAIIDFSPGARPSRGVAWNMTMLAVKVCTTRSCWRCTTPRVWSLGRWSSVDSNRRAGAGACRREGPC